MAQIRCHCTVKQTDEYDSENNIDTDDKAEEGRKTEGRKGSCKTHREHQHKLNIE